MATEADSAAPRRFSWPWIVSLDGWWTEAGPEDDPRARLLATLYVNQTPHHVEALAVDDVEDVVRNQAVHPDYEHMVDQVADAVASQGSWQTVEIDGRNYVLIITPHDA